MQTHAYRVALLLAALALPATAVAQVIQELRGDAEHFGPGFTGLTDTRVEFRLLRPGNAVLFWVKPDGGVDLVFPVRSGDRTARRAGSHAISLTDVRSPIEAPVISGTPVGASAGHFNPSSSQTMTNAAKADTNTAVSGYWVLLVADAAFTAPDIRSRLGPMSREGGGLAVMDRLPPLLVREGIPWAMYIAAVVIQ